MRRTNKKKYGVILFTLILAIGVVAGAYALLNDTVTLTGTATVKEKTVGLEIVSADNYAIGCYGGGMYGGEDVVWEISTDKKTATFNLGEITVDENGAINSWNIAKDQFGNPISGVEAPLGMEGVMTIKNTGTVPVQISYVVNGTDFTFTENNHNDGTNNDLSEGYSIQNEVLAAGATCTFHYFFNTAKETYTPGSTLTGGITITGTEYTGEGTALSSHEHGPLGGY